MKKHLILISFAFSLYASFSQNIYNFGNKYTIGYSANILKIANFHLLEKDNISVGLNQHEIVLQRILTNKVSLIMSYTFSKKSTELGLYKSPDFVIAVKDSSGNNYQRLKLEPSGTAIVRTNIFNVGIRRYQKGKGAIAPFGRFFEFKAGLAKIHHKMDEDHVVYYYENGKYLKDELPDYGISHLNILSFQAGYGVSVPIVKNFYFDWLLNLNLNVPLWKGIKRTDEVNYRDLYFYRNARLLYGAFNRLRFNIGLHYGF